MLRPLRLDVADRVEAAGQHVLQLGQRHQPAVRLAQRRQVADLAHRDQPLVGLVALRHGLEQVDLLVRRRQPGEVELAQPVQLQPLGDLRVQAADQPVLGEPPAPTRPRWPGGRNVKWCCMAEPLVPTTVTVTRAIRAPCRRQRARRQQLAEPRRERVGVRLARPGDVQVGDHAAVGRLARPARRPRRARPGRSAMSAAVAATRVTPSGPASSAVTNRQPATSRAVTPASLRLP